MEIERITAAYFSPTGGTRQYVCELAARLGAEYQEVNLADVSQRKHSFSFGSGDLVIFGAPVYAGRLPVLEGGLFSHMHGDGTPAVFLVSYGNRAYDDALLELKSTCEEQGFRGIAAGAFIAPHSFSERIGAGRPNADDLACLDGFAAQISQVLKAPAKDAPLKVPGSFPYRAVKKLPFAPCGNRECSQCGRCVSICPTGAISAENPRKTDRSRCVDCLACVRQCPQQSRRIQAPLFRAAVKKLESNLLQIEKKPETFLVGNIQT